MTRQRSITVRLTMLFATASTAVLLAVGILIGIVVESHFEEQDHAELRGKLELIRHALVNIQSVADLGVLPRRLADALIGHPGLSVTVIGPNNKTVFSTTGTVFPAALLDRNAAAREQMRPVSWRQDGHAYSGIAASIPAGLTSTSPFLVAIAVDTQHRQQFMWVFQRTLWILFIFGIGLSAILGWLAAHQGLAPVRRIAMAAKGISANQLNDRLVLDTIPTELHDLAESFNGMLSRLEDSFQRLSNFSSDLAHELRTPISNLMTQTQVALSKVRSAEDYREILASNLEEYDRLARMVSDMLFLAKAEHGLVVGQWAPVDLAAEIRQVIEFYEPLAEESGIVLKACGEGAIVGDRFMMRRALSNLLSNALQHTERGGTITAAVSRRDGGELVIGISNPGPGIAPNHIAHLFDRFYRIDPSRKHSGEGTGLGLAITKSIVEAHGGRIAVISGDGMTRFEIILPGTDPVGRE